MLVDEDLMNIGVEKPRVSLGRPLDLRIDRIRTEYLDESPLMVTSMMY